MRRTLTLAAASLAGLALATQAEGSGSATQHCRRTFDSHMIRRAIGAEFAGVRDIVRQDSRDVARFIRCARPTVSRPAMRRYRNAAAEAWAERRNPPMNGPVIASYYTTEGVGACGYGSVQSGYRFASLILGCGQWIHVCHRARCEDAEMVDRGPYVGGRTFDLNANLRAALGCGGICSVTWRYR